MSNTLYNKIKACETCKLYLPNSPKPIFQFSSKSKIAIIGQAPGQKVHDVGIPFYDKSGETLRRWIGVTEEQFYNPDLFAIVPMSFCFPGKGRTGDLPPRKECAPQWHSSIFSHIKKLELVFLIGTYSQDYYLAKRKKKNLTETVLNYEEYLPKFFPLVHPSPLNFRWQANNPWFEKELVPIIQQTVKQIIKNKK